MRHGLLLAAALAFAAPAMAADLPPVVMQIAAPGKLLDDIREMARALGGEAMVQKFNDSLKTKLGEKGLSGLDLNRPSVFGLYFRENAPEDANAYGIGIAPYVDEKDFVALVEKGQGTVKPVEGKKGRYVVTSPDGKTSQLLFKDGFVYAGFDMSEAEFDPAKFPTYDKLVTQGDQSLMTARVYIERLPASFQKKMGQSLDDAMAGLANMPFPPDAKEGVKKAAEKLGAAAKQYLEQVKDVKEGVVRIVFDKASAEVSLEMGIIGAAGSSLAKDIAARSPSQNRFAGLVTGDTAGGLLLGLPLSNMNIREGMALAFEASGKEGLNTAPPPATATLEELVKGIARTLRSGELDFGAGIAGPDKDSHYRVQLGLSFDNPAALEKELRGLYKNAPPAVKTLLKLDAAKIGDLNVHVARLGPALPPEAQRVFGDEAELAFTFAPKGIYVVFGTDPLTTLKAAIATQPQPARGLEVLVNPNRLEKLVSAAAGPPIGAKVAEMLGAENKLLSAFFASVEGGAELKIRMGMSLKLLPRMGLMQAQ